MGERSRRFHGRKFCDAHRQTQRLCGDYRTRGVHLLNGPYDAKMDSTPVLAITGSTFNDLGGSVDECIDATADDVE
jgi:hypothetical protein